MYGFFCHFRPCFTKRRLTQVLQQENWKNQKKTIGSWLQNVRLVGYTACYGFIFFCCHSECVSSCFTQEQEQNWTTLAIWGWESWQVRYSNGLTLHVVCAWFQKVDFLFMAELINYTVVSWHHTNRSLVRNLFMTFLSSQDKKREEIARLIGKILGLPPEQLDQVRVHSTLVSYLY